MKIGERHWEQDGKLIVQETHDPNPVLEQTRVLRDQREAGGPQIADGKHVARIPYFLLEQKAQERGVQWDDREAMRAIVQEIVMDPQYAHFRVWEGRPW
jgi:hypothetical protein